MIKRQKEKERKESGRSRGREAVSFDFSTGYRPYIKTKSLSVVEWDEQRWYEVTKMRTGPAEIRSPYQNTSVTPGKRKRSSLVRITKEKNQSIQFTTK